VYFAPEPGAEVCMQGLFDALRERGFTEGHTAYRRAPTASSALENTLKIDVKPAIANTSWT